MYIYIYIYIYTHIYMYPLGDLAKVLDPVLVGAGQDFESDARLGYVYKHTGIDNTNKTSLVL